MIVHQRPPPGPSIAPYVHCSFLSQLLFCVLLQALHEPYLACSLEYLTTPRMKTDKIILAFFNQNKGFNVGKQLVQSDTEIYQAMRDPITGRITFDSRRVVPIHT
jgi:hypothetical protein